MIALPSQPCIHTSRSSTALYHNLERRGKIGGSSRTPYPHLSTGSVACARCQPRRPTLG